MPLPITHIRTTIFGLTQGEFANLACASQATVSRWENGELIPDAENLARIRDAARERGIDWNDSWFFDAPAEPEQASP